MAFRGSEVAAFRDISHNDEDIRSCLTALFLVALVLGMLMSAVLIGRVGVDGGERRAGTGKAGGKDAGKSLVQIDTGFIGRG